MEKLKNCKLNTSSNGGLFHDSRKDVRTLSEVINRMSSKIDELVEANNKMQQKLTQLKQNQ